MNTYKSFYKTVKGGEGERCNYPTRLDLYGKGCYYNCNYCYSKQMLKEARKKLRGEYNIAIQNKDIIQDDFEVKNCGAILSILTLQFIPLEYRQEILKKVYDSLGKNGIFIFVEKIIGDNYNYSELYEQLYYNMKFVNGYTVDEIRNKRMKLEGVLVPVTNQFNIDLLKQAGFTKIDIFWKDLNFIGYIVMK